MKLLAGLVPNFLEKVSPIRFFMLGGSWTLTSVLSQEIIKTAAQLCELDRCLQDKNSLIMTLTSLSFCFLIDFDLIIHLLFCQLFNAFNIFLNEILFTFNCFHWENWVNNLA